MPFHQMISAERLVLLAALVVAVIPPAAGAALTGYRAKAEEITDFIQAGYYDPAVYLYRPWLPSEPNDLPHDYMWGNGVQFTVLTAATRHNPAKYRQILADFTGALHKYWKETDGVPGFEDTFYPKPEAGKYYDDNAWLVLGFVEAYDVTKDKAYLDWARETQKFCLSGWDEKLGGGIYWFEDHKSKNTCANAPTAAAAARLYLVGHDKDQLEWAKRIVAWTNKTFQDKDGLFWDNITVDGKMNEMKWTYNSALMVRADTLLYQATKDPKYLADARRIADAGLKHWVDPATGGFKDNARFNHLFSESLLRLYDVTTDIRYLNAVRKDASFAYRYVRDPKGGYHNHWRKHQRNPDERKELIEQAAAARLFWLLSDYPDVDDLTARGIQAADKGDATKAEDLLRQASESDAEAVEATYRLWELLDNAGKTADAAEAEKRLTAMAEDPALLPRLTAAGWKAKANG